MHGMENVKFLFSFNFFDRYHSQTPSKQGDDRQYSDSLWVGWSGVHIWELLVLPIVFCITPLDNSPATPQHVGDIVKYFGYPNCSIHSWFALII